MGTLMNSKERILCTLDRQETDRVPIAMRGLEPLDHLWGGKKNLFERSRVLRDKFGIDDFLFLRHCWPYSKEVREEIEWDKWGENNDPLLISKYHTPAGTLSTRVVMTNDYHAERLFLGADALMPRSVERLIKELDDIQKLKYLLPNPSECDTAEWDSQMSSYVQFGREEGFPIGLYIPSFSGFSMKNIGTTEIVMKAMDSDPLVEGIFDAYLEWALQWIEYAATFEPDVVYHSGYLESTDFWSPELFRKYFAPRQKKLSRKAHQCGMKYINYITTGINALIDDLSGLGIDALYGWDPVPPGDADIHKLKNVLGNEMVFWGGISPTMTIERGTAGQVREAVRELIDVFASDGGYILCTGGSVYFEAQVGMGGETWKGTPEDSRAYNNLMTLFEAGLEYGKHSLKI